MRCSLGRPCIVWALHLIAIVSASGCGSSSGYPVQGTVVWSDEKPAIELAGGVVTFDSEETRTSGVAEIDKEGRFHVKSGSGTGLPPGKYRISISGPSDEEQRDDRPVVKGKKSLLLARYQSFETSQLEATVESKSNEVTLKLDRAKP